jgi:hypothetical protein
MPILESSRTLTDTGKGPQAQKAVALALTSSSWWLLLLMLFDRFVAKVIACWVERFYLFVLAKSSVWRSFRCVVVQTALPETKMQVRM